MRALVTGVAGFIGSHLAEELINRGLEVVGIDCFTPYYPARLKRENVRSLLSRKRFRLIKEDILRTDLASLVRRSDIVFHLAAQPGVRLSWSMFNLYVKNNLLATQAILRECSRLHKKLVFASSSSVYGDSETYPTSENAPLRPVSPYGVTKQACERLCALYERNCSLEVAILRYFTVFGPRQRPDMAIHKFIELALKGSSLPVYGDGSQERDFTFVSDIVAGTIAAAERNAWGQTMNLGGGRASKLLDVINLVLHLTGSRSRIKYEPPQMGDARKTAADVSKARMLLGYNPAVSMEGGIRRQVEWQKKTLA